MSIQPPVARPAGGQFQKVLDGRKQPIRGLWTRNGEFYAQLRVPGKKSAVRTRLLVSSLEAAKKAIEKLRVQRREGSMPSLARAPKLVEWIDEYFAHLQKTGAKRRATISSETSRLRAWIDHIGHVRLSDITVSQVERFIESRKAEGCSGRTCDLDIISLNNVLKYARKLRIIDRQLPTAGYEPMAEEPKERPLWTREQIQTICGAAAGKNAEQFVHYIWFLAFSGMRRDEAIRRRWDEVNWDRDRGHITIDAQSKGKYARKVHLSDELRSHLEIMRATRAPDSAYIFPSPWRGDQDLPAKSFRDTLEAARTEAAKRSPALADFQLHDLRHYFISTCVMCGIDFMTIAKWVGHRDGGILIGKVYGHLADEHLKRMAAKVVFSPRVVQMDLVAQTVEQPQF